MIFGLGVDSWSWICSTTRGRQLLSKVLGHQVLGSTVRSRGRGLRKRSACFLDGVGTFAIEEFRDGNLIEGRSVAVSAELWGSTNLDIPL